MIRIIAKALIGLYFLVAVSAYGAILNAKIEGMIISFDKENVTLEGNDGKRFKVPRSAVDSANIKSGKWVKIELQLDPKEIKFE